MMAIAKLPRLFIALISFVVFSASAQDLEKDKTYTFGVVPQHSASKIVRLWSPILEEVSVKCDCRLIVRTAKNIPEFENMLSKGEYDFAYMNPFHFTVFNTMPGYKALARQRDKLIYGILVTQKNSIIKSIEELNGAKLAFPSPAAFAASILPRGNLKNLGIDYTPVYVSSHDSVYLNVSKGIFNAGGGIIRTLNNVDSEVKDNLRVLWKSKGYTPHAIAVHPRVPASVRNTIQKGFVELNRSENGAKLLKSISFKKGLVEAEDGDWDDVRSLNLNEL